MTSRKIKPIVLALTSAIFLATVSLETSSATVEESFGKAKTAQNTYRKSAPAKFFKDKEQGWYWYHDPETGELIKMEPVKPPEGIDPPKKPKTDEEIAREKPFSAQWVRVMLPRYLDRAWNDPTPENVQAYFLVQKFALDRAQKFANTARQVVVGNMLLDNTITRPSSQIGVKTVDRQTVLHRDALLKKLSEKVGLFFFFSSTCPHCATQAPIVKMFENTYKFKVMAISVDGGELETTKFDSTKTDAGHAAKLGVTAVPSIYLMNDKGEFDLISASIVSLSDLESRVLVTAERQGWITKEEAANLHYTAAGKQPNLSEEMPKLLKASQNGDLGALMGADAGKMNSLARMDGADKRSLADEDGFVEPGKLIALMSRLTGASTGKLNTKQIKGFKHENTGD